MKLCLRLENYGKRFDHGFVRHVHYHSKRKSVIRILELDLQTLELSCSESKWNGGHYLRESVNMKK